VVSGVVVVIGRLAVIASAPNPEGKAFPKSIFKTALYMETGGNCNEAF